MASATVNVAGANLRAAPSTDAAILGPLAQGSAVDIMADNDDGSWHMVSATVDGTLRFGWVQANQVAVSAQAAAGGQDHSDPNDKPTTQVPDGTKPVGDPVPFTTKPSSSGNQGGQSTTTGLNGTEQKFDDGSSVIEATEGLAASRTGGFNAKLTATCRRVSKAGVTTVDQSNYSYANRKLAQVILSENVDGLATDVPAGFTATAPRDVIASQFGKNDRDDEGTGSPNMGLIQTNSEVFGASIKVSKMAENFGAGWQSNASRLTALIEIHSARTRRRVRVPLVDVGPGETIRAEVDLTWACDQFLGTRGQGEVTYRLLIPS